MLTGNIGIAVVIASMMAAFVQQDPSGGNGWIRALMLSAALMALWVIGTQSWVDQTIEHVIAWSLTKWTSIDVRDYVSLLHLADGYVVYEIKVKPDDWIADKLLSDSRLTAEGVLILGIHRASGKYDGSPSGKTLIHVGDVLSVYGPKERLEELDIRKRGREGDIAHENAVSEKTLRSEGE